MVEPFLCEVCGEQPLDPMITACCAACMCASHLSSLCALCEMPCDPSQARPNLLLRRYLTRNSDCDRCALKPALFHCSGCQTALCKDCCATIHSLGVYRKHTVLPIPQGKSLLSDDCPTHSLHSLSHFCSDDWESLCSDCLPQHETHSVLTLNTVQDEVIREINSKDCILKEKIAKITTFSNQINEKITEIAQITEKSKSQIKSQFQLLKDQLSLKEDEILRFIDSQISPKMRELLQNSKEITRNKGKFEAISQFLSFAKDQNASILVPSYRFLTTLIENLPEIPPNFPSIPSLNFSLMSIKALEIEKLIGNMSVEEQSELDMSCMSSRQSVNTASMPDLQAERTQRHTNKTSKSPLGRQGSIKADFTVSPMGKPGAKVAFTPRTSYRPSSSHGKSTDDSTATKPHPALSASLDETPLGQRVFIRKAQSASAIQVSWNHPLNPPPGLNYVLEYGVGTRLGGVEQFRQVYKGTARTCIITDLLPKTAYRFRVAPLVGEEQGEWSEVVSIATFDQQGVDVGSCGQHAIWTSRGGDKYLTFEKPGIVTASNPVLFGKVSWEVRITSTASFPQEDSPSALKIGVIAGKTKVVVGSTIIYSGKSTSKVRVCLDSDARILTCYTPSHPQGEQFPHLPEGALLPAVMNKPGRTASNVKVWVTFDLPFEISS